MAGKSLFWVVVMTPRKCLTCSTQDTEYSVLVGVYSDKLRGVAEFFPLCCCTNGGPANVFKEREYLGRRGQ